jgi:hypothetical protein
MVHAGMFDECKKSVEFYKEHGFKYTLRRIVKKGELNSKSNAYIYTPEQLEWIFAEQLEELAIPNIPIFYMEQGKEMSRKVHSNEIASSNKNKFIGWVCWAGLDHLAILEDGAIYRGQCRVGDKIGSIFDDVITLPSEPIVCTKEVCACSPGIALEKYKRF